MMAQRRLTDSELAARLRQRNRQASERRRERLVAGGKVQLLAWIPATLRSELDRVAAARGEPLSDTTTVLLSLGLKQTATTTPATKPTAAEMTAELFPAPATTTEKDALMMEVGKLLNEGHTGNEIARQLNASGQRTANGAEFSGHNLLRDYRAWAKKTGAVDATTTKEPT
jgi:hypothetical protein